MPDQEIETVLISADGHTLSFHDPTQLDSHEGMVSVSRDEALDRGAVACARCFSNGSKVMYDFPYLE